LPHLAGRLCIIPDAARLVNRFIQKIPGNFQLLGKRTFLRKVFCILFLFAKVLSAPISRHMYKKAYRNCDRLFCTRRRYRLCGAAATGKETG
jgi:hypothetical protein